MRVTTLAILASAALAPSVPVVQARALPTDNVPLEANATQSMGLEKRQGWWYYPGDTCVRLDRDTSTLLFTDSRSGLLYVGLPWASRNPQLGLHGFSSEQFSAIAYRNNFFHRVRRVGTAKIMSPTTNT